ncbi:MAG: hypothetical protein CM1200mP9_02740 [Gammaproteobacteria bacterium]|nr:MAG: hypothetical protein CM1200mP9_02740 [Gammaproteobacteria bacterium]
MQTDRWWVFEANAYRILKRYVVTGGATSARIYAEAYGRDPDFFEFYRSINAYKDVFQGKNDKAGH